MGMSPTLSRLISLALEALPRYEAGATAGPLGLLDARGWLVGARGFAPPPPTFRSRCAWPSLPSLASGYGAHDETDVPPSPACHRA